MEIPTFALMVGSGDVIVCETYRGPAEARAVAAALREMLRDGADRVSVLPPCGERPSGWTVLVLGHQTTVALDTRVPSNTIRPVAWAKGVRP